jgi:diamine N-acetyltransferase
VNRQPELIFREARVEDVPALLPMMRRLALQEPALPFDEQAVAAVWEQFLRHGEFGRAWLLCIDNKPVGYVILTLGFSFEYRGQEAFIDELYVEEGYRRQGFGQRAMEFAAERARSLGVNVIHLEVDRTNVAALELYRRLGYVDHDRYLMTKWIAGNE